LLNNICQIRRNKNAKGCLWNKLQNKKKMFRHFVIRSYTLFVLQDNVL
jgi:hypothetical protein